MEYKQIKRMDNQKVSVLALGLWAAGASNWGGDVDDKKSARAVLAALDAGVNIIDTAPVYGFGHSEELLGAAIRGFARDKFFISTKCGLVNKNANPFTKELTEDSIRTEVNMSLHRLNTDYIDIYFTHWPDPNTPLAETYGAMAELKAEGKIRYVGACNVDPELLKKIDKICPLSFVQNEYSYLKPAAGQAVFDYCAQNGIGFMAYGPLAGGVLSGKYRSEPKFGAADVRSFFYKFYQGGGFGAAAAAVKKFEQIAKKYARPVAAVALRWVVQSAPCAIALAGAKNDAQVKQNALAAGFELTADDMEFLNAR